MVLARNPGDPHGANNIADFRSFRTHLFPPRAMMPIWLAVAVARTAWTAIGAWLAESMTLDIGLPVATAISTATFVVLLAAWPKRRAEDPAYA